MSGSLNIPLCRSEFLQNFTIHLVLILEPKYRWGGFASKVEICKRDGKELERFIVWITGIYRTRVNLILWEDKTIWISAALIPENSEKFQVSFSPDFRSFGIEGVVEALLNTVCVTTCLCYDKSPELLLRQIWKYTGDVETEGVL
jgi:hypothetical protein